ncbi:MAG TPA: hypothetical protein VM573_06045 [Actinomycetota bacterium]|nr:hypothetical protein [Actinomycetota bacterium]
MSDVEARLRQLGREVAEEVPSSLAPREDVPVRARRRRSWVAAFSATTVVALAAAGYAGVTVLREPPAMYVGPNVLNAAGATTQAEGTARAKVKLSLDFETSGISITSTVTGGGEISFEENRSHTRLRVAANGIPGTVMEVIQDGSTSYMKNRGETGTWVKYSGPSAAPVAGLTADPRVSPADYLRHLDDISHNVEVLGEEDIDGDPATHYRAELNEASLADFANPLKEMGFDLEVDYDPLDVWIDERGRIRKMFFGMRVDGEKHGSPMSGRVATTVSFFDFGAPVEIELPDPDQVTDEFGGAEPRSSISDGFPDDTVVLGSRGWKGPRLIVQKDSPSICVFNVPSWVTRVELVKSNSGAVVATIHGESLKASELFGCGDLASEDPRVFDARSPAYTLHLTNGKRTLEEELVRLRLP